MRRRFIMVLSCGVACVHPHEEHPHADHQATHASPHWDYEGREGPSEWATLDPEFRRCATGHQQSPIDLDLAVADHVALPALAFHYGAAPVVELDNGHTVEDRVPRGEHVVYRGSRYELEQFHFHHPSEHTLAGRQFPLEVHMVHRSATGALLVIGVFVAEGVQHDTLEALFERLPRAGESVTTTTDPTALLPADRHYVTYEGSLTTPPCAEGVTWIVMTHPIEATAPQIARFAQKYPHNNRPVMPRNGRHVLADP